MGDSSRGMRRFCVGESHFPVESDVLAIFICVAQQHKRNWREWQETQNPRDSTVSLKVKLPRLKLKI